MTKEVLKKVASIATMLSMSSMAIFATFEPTQVIAQSANDSIEVNLTVTSGISITSPSDVTMSPALSTSNNESTGNAVWTVTTNDTDGYTLVVAADTNPALQSDSDQFADYTEATPDTPEVWSVSNAYEFGFGAFGDDVDDGTWGAGSSCGAGTIPSNIHYQGFNGTSTVQIASSNDVTTTSGTATTVCFAAEQAGVFAPSGTYNATITATATVQ